MSRTVEVSDLVGLSDLARELSVEVSTCHVWARRYADFPSPLATVSRVRIYSRSEILGWLERRRPYGRVLNGQKVP